MFVSLVTEVVTEVLSPLIGKTMVVYLDISMVSLNPSALEEDFLKFWEQLAYM